MTRVTRLTDSGVSYCTAHNGVIDCDEERCDFIDPSDPEQKCQPCDGTGTDPEDENEVCDECDGEGLTPCKATPLLYREEVPT